MRLQNAVNYNFNSKFITILSAYINKLILRYFRFARTDPGDNDLRKMYDTE